MGFLDRGRAQFCSASYLGLPGNPVLNFILFLPVTVTLSVSLSFLILLSEGRWSGGAGDCWEACFLVGLLLLWGPQFLVEQCTPGS